jgi:putative membrane protein
MAMEEDAGPRDRLALQRTALANERTLLAYVRTAIALVAAGASSIHFLEGLLVDVLGWILVAAGVGTQGIGLWRYRRARAMMREPGR